MFFAVTYSENIIPKMTSDTAPSGIASASDHYSNVFEPYRAFDKLYDPANPDYNSWISNLNTGWLAYEFTSPKIVTQYRITGRWTNYTTINPKDWTFEGWDGTQWVVLDTQTNITNWTSEPKSFPINNTKPYIKYRLNITKNNGYIFVQVSELEMMETVSTAPPNAPLNLTGTAGNAQASLTWSAVYDATSYNVKRSMTAGGQYTTIATNVYATNYTDNNLINGTTYYYVIIAINSAGESGNSNEIAVTPSAITPPPQTGGNRALLVITMTNGFEKEYDLTITELNAFLTWYDNKANGTGPARYTISKSYNKGPFLSREESIIFGSILTFEVMEY